jgi:tripartite-type tricarboxylate transporter receptor subunit TctC
MIESGYPTFNMPGWGGLIATAGTPPDVIVKLNQEVQRAVARPELRQRLFAAGMEPPPLYGPADVQEFIANDIARWTEFVDAVGIEKLKGEAPRQ